MIRTRLAVAVSLVALVIAGLSIRAVCGADDKSAPPARKWVVYILPHSHVDIGYTHLQPEVEQKQWRNLEAAIDLCRKTAENPPEARFKWNTEVLWAVDSYLRKAPPEKQQQLVDAVRAGQIELNALYGNELTGLCRPEELLRLMQWGVALGRRCGVTVDTAMISDVPGYTWGIVPALQQAGVKYFSIGPNLADRIGRTLSEWEDKPFYWLAPDGQHKVLCWIPYKGYAVVFWAPGGFSIEKTLMAHLNELEKRGYPYDMVQLRWTIGGDNGPPDAALPDLVKNWNAQHDSPKLVLATTSQLFREFEQRYAGQIPTVSGDFTPYWEDGAGSSARETALNRTAAERLTQAEALTAMFAPRQYPAAQFTEAWRNVLLYDEHTWGAHNSISQPDLPFVKEQWKIKQAFALDADQQSHALLHDALAKRTEPAATATDAAVDVFNTSAWPRTELVVLSKTQSAAGGAVSDAAGAWVPSQRLAGGELAFLAQEVPPLAGKRYTLHAEEAKIAGRAKAAGNTLGNANIAVQVDPASGAIASLRFAPANAELSDAQSGVGLNRYYYVLADRVKEAQQAGAPRITVKDAGPLVASLLVESAAPGCAQFTREIRVVDGLDRVDLIDVVDKKAVREKEAVHLGFAFHVPGGQMRMDIPWAIIRPEIDQMPGACKNWFSVGRWVDISNADYGVTWATLDAPLVEVGGMTANVMGPLKDPAAWRGTVEPTQTLYSWAMNNHWYTNYRAEQSGPTTFRYALLPHRQYDAAAAERFGVGCSQPLVVAPARGPAPSAQPLLTIDAPNVLIAAVKPSEDGRAWIVRLFNTADQAAAVTPQWGAIKPRGTWLSNLAEDRLTAVAGAIDVPRRGLVTIRADLPE